MLLNLRAKCTNNNGTSITYTWRQVDCQNEEHAKAVALEWALAEEKRWKSPDATFPYQNKNIEVSFPSTEELDEEHDQYIRDKVELDLMYDPDCYG